MELTTQEVVFVLTTAITIAGFVLMLVHRAVEHIVPRKTVLTCQEQQTLFALLRKMDENEVWHKQVDNDGIPLAYMPRSVVENQERIAENLLNTSNILTLLQRDAVAFHSEAHENFRDLHKKLNNLKR